MIRRQERNGEMAEFGLVESFQIDDGSLDGLSRQECFVLGYEFLQFCHALNSFSEGNNHLVHIANAGRLAKAAESRGKKMTVRYLSDDKSEEWCRVSWVHVGNDRG